MCSGTGHFDMLVGGMVCTECVVRLLGSYSAVVWWLCGGKLKKFPDSLLPGTSTPHRLGLVFHTKSPYSTKLNKIRNRF